MLALPIWVVRKEGVQGEPSVPLAKSRSVLWIPEMTKEEIERVGETGPTIDSIEIREFGSQDAMKDWLQKNAPGFLPKSLT
jgi:hypothetical protein